MLPTNSFCCELLDSAERGELATRILPHKVLLEMTNREHTETTIRKRQLWFVGGAVWQNESHLLKSTIFGRFGRIRGPRRPVGPPNTEDTVVSKNIRALGVLPRRKSTTGMIRLRCGSQRRIWLRHCGGEHVQMASWCRGRGGRIQKGARRRADKRESNLCHEREAAASIATTRESRQSEVRHH